MVFLKNLFSRRYTNLKFEKFDSAQANTARSHLFREYLRENEFLSKTILACFLGAQMASIHEIKKDKKSRDTAPLKSKC